ncbi:uncharacterized protein PHACADRAFT_204658 [Phanerochaete carnosa HHB-10118-sp]|uniref:Uncharacterized protein n=1 Tax=Phanerochaete carnosa (strain HHB-10118-sp) TaxID=650164 RepID=K5WPU7_PHACS|nr:uncharacterized protein PHACADRAFT_204658 [Phanerochaete carnosa HHB-10118-sp]EKM61490.1 hypothetical protein PHACADRAFT_204658 [Phanerochaete carnosa HHB-10118-sp]
MEGMLSSAPSPAAAVHTLTYRPGPRTQIWTFIMTKHDNDGITSIPTGEVAGVAPISASSSTDSVHRSTTVETPVAPRSDAISAASDIDEGVPSQPDNEDDINEENGSDAEIEALFEEAGAEVRGRQHYTTQVASLPDQKTVRSTPTSTVIPEIKSGIPVASTTLVNSELSDKHLTRKLSKSIGPGEDRVIHSQTDSRPDASNHGDHGTSSGTTNDTPDGPAVPTAALVTASTAASTAASTKASLAAPTEAPVIVSVTASPASPVPVPAPTATAAPAPADTSRRSWPQFFRGYCSRFTACCCC